MKRIIIVLFLIIANAYAMAQTSVWNGGKKLWTNGSGTESDPYLVESAENLAFLAYIVNKGFDTKGAYFKLTVDVDLNGSSNQLWTPIGLGPNVYSEDGCERGSTSVCNTSFQGHFDGDGHTISNLYIETDPYAGLFGLVIGTEDSLVIIKNVIVSDGLIKGSIAGGIVATGNVQVKGCKNGADVEGEIAGGVVGDGSRVCKVRNCINNGNVKGGVAGGIVGENPLEIIECYNSGEIASDSICSGGLSGELYRTSVVNNCYNTGLVSATVDFAGGLFGVSRNNKAVVTNCYNVGPVLCDGLHVDGIGTSGKKYEKCYCLDTYGPSEVGTMMTAEAMRALSFVDTLSVLNEGVWGPDVNNVNDGFPILIKNSISVSELILPQLSVFPNPANSHIVVQGAPMKRIMIFDVFGRKVYDKEVNPYAESVSVSIEGLPNALYVLRVLLSDDTFYSQSILVFGK